MSSLRKWWTRLATMITAAMVAVFVPVAAWAASDTGNLAIEAAYRRRRGYGGGLGTICCLVVVAAIVLVVLLLRRRRGGGGPR